ncbi:MAG: hypothetical protein MUF81_20425 [Verrucomicrobia bacterium]|nr:hypothetical protein [Verrucomicrobiota bacterium]
MNVTSQIEEQGRTKGICCVVVIYEDAATRHRAMNACDFLMQQLWSEVEFDFHWWRADFLEHAVMAHTAAEQAVAADFLIFCSSAENEFSPTLKMWFESWIEDRHGRDGALLNLTTSSVTETGSAGAMEAFLRGVARRAMLDYFASSPRTLTGTLPASLEEAEQRATLISSVLDEILNHPPRPPSFGIND